MKAKVRATGEIVEVEELRDYNFGTIYYKLVNDPDADPYEYPQLDFDIMTDKKQTSNGDKYMTTEELAKRRAWATCHFGDKNLTDEELATATYMSSENFSDGWDKGSEYALSHQWIPVDERLPEPDTMSLVFGYHDFGDGNITRYTMMAWYDGEDFSDAYDDRKYRPERWMPIPLVPPQLNPEKEER